MRRSVLTLAIVIVLGYAGLCGYLYVQQRSLLYFPQPRPPGDRTPTITLATESGDVLISVRPAQGAKAVLYFGGNGEIVTWSLPDLEAAYPDASLYLMNYRGYGGSAGAPSETALIADALALYDRVHAEHTGITVVGRSLGSGIAVQVASARAVERVVLVTPYNSVADIAARTFPFVPVRWLLRDKYESWRFAPRVTAPTVLITAENDEGIPRWSTDALLAQFPRGVATMKIIAGAGHNTVQDSADYVPSLRGVP